MAKIKKLNRATDQRLAVIRNQASYLLWYGKLETTVEKAKNLRSYVEKLLTFAVNSYEDTVKVEKSTVDANGVETTRTVINDGPKKLNARREIMKKVYDIQEQKENKESKPDFVKRTKDIKHPLMEKIFNVYAPKYAERKKETGNGGGYTRVIRIGARKGDNADMAIIELV